MANPPRASLVSPEDAAFIQERLPLYFTWLDNLAVRIDNEHIGRPMKQGVVEMLEDLMVIAMVPRAQRGGARDRNIRWSVRNYLIRRYGVDGFGSEQPLPLPPG